MKTLLPVLFLVVGAVVIFFERKSVATLRAENAAWREQHQMARTLLEENAALAKEMPAASGAPAAFDRSELLRLRNEVRRLRSTPSDPAPLRAENERLAADLKSGKIKPPRLADQPGFVARDTWANLGAATPEATLQTMFFAMHSADVGVLLTVLGDGEGRSMREQYQKNPEKMRAEFAEQAAKNFQPTGFVITDREELSDGKVRLKVRFAAQSEPLEFEFKRDGEAWKVSKAF